MLLWEANGASLTRPAHKGLSKVPGETDFVQRDGGGRIRTPDLHPLAGCFALRCSVEGGAEGTLTMVNVRGAIKLGTPLTGRRGRGQVSAWACAMGITEVTQSW